MKYSRRNGLYMLNGSVVLPDVITNVSNDKTRLWHMRLAHMSEKWLKELSKQGLLGTDQISALEFCEKCVFGKATRQKFNLGKQETKNTMEMRKSLKKNNLNSNINSLWFYFVKSFSMNCK